MHLESSSNASFVGSVVASRPLLVAAARRLVAACDVEVLVHNTLERAIVHQADYCPGSNLLAWLRRMMFNLTIDEWRRRRRFLTSPLDEQKEPACAVEEPPPWEGVTPEQLRAALRELSPEFRQVIELHHCWRLPYTDIARQLRIPSGTVGTRLLRARRQLRDLLVPALEGRAGESPGPAPADAAAIAPLPRRKEVRARGPRAASRGVGFSAARAALA
jgi:RNA polymerase sigma-70 factor (ECF subfamily)